MKAYFKIWACMVALLLLTLPVAGYAHPHYCHGEVSNVAATGNWIIKQNGYHDDDGSFTYYFTASLSTLMRSYVDLGASYWRTANIPIGGYYGINYSASSNNEITGQSDGMGDGQQGSYTGLVPTYVAGNHFHAGSFLIWMNENVMYTHNHTAVVAAHEFGHAVGLEDLGNGKEQMLMHNDLNRTNFLTTNDLKGAAIISGKHSSHSYSGNVCTQCDGYY